MSDDAHARESLVTARGALERGEPIAALDALEIARRLPFGALAAPTHREIGQLSRELLKPAYDAALQLLTQGEVDRAARLEARLGRLLPGDRQHEAVRAAHDVTRRGALLQLAATLLREGDPERALIRLALVLDGVDRAPAELRAEAERLGRLAAEAAVPKLLSHAREGDHGRARGIASALGVLPPSAFEAVSAEAAEAWEKLARGLMEAAVAALGEGERPLQRAGQLARACGELRPPVRLSAAFAQDRGALRELYAESALAAAEARLDRPGPGVEAARDVLEAIRPLDWRRLPSSTRKRFLSVTSHARGAARLEVLQALERGGPAVRAAAALHLLQVASVEHAEAQFLDDAGAREEAERKRLVAIQLARASLELRSDPEPDDRPLRVVEREIETKARAALDAAVAQGIDEDEASGDAVPLAVLLEARLELDHALAVEERGVVP